MRFEPALFAVVLAAASLPSLAQTRHAAAAAATPAAAARMTNSDVMALASAGLGDDVIETKIHAASGTNFDTSVDGLKALKAAGVSSSVIRVMIDPSAPVVVPAAAVAAAAVVDPDDPSSAHSPGIYIQAPGKDGGLHLIKLDHITSKGTKTSGMWLSGATYGIAKAHTKASIDGSAATMHTQDTNPVFYAFIPEDNTTFGGSGITVKDFTLIRLDPKNETREVNTATISPWGFSTGTDQKAEQGFATDTVKPGVFKLTLIQALPPGQYAFQTQNYGAFYDFGITAVE